MHKPGLLPLAGDRFTPFVRTISLLGVDLTDAVFKLQVRLLPDTPGTPLADLGTVGSASAEGVRLIYGGTDTYANHIAAGRWPADEIPAGSEASDSIALSQLGIRINESTMEAMPDATEVGDNLDLHWDMHITPDGGLKQRWLYGPFRVRAGVTV